MFNNSDPKNIIPATINYSCPNGYDLNGCMCIKKIKCVNNYIYDTTEIPSYQKTEIPNYLVTKKPKKILRGTSSSDISNRYSAIIPKSSCPNGLRNDGISCWDDIKCNTNCGGCGCIKNSARYCAKGHINMGLYKQCKGYGCKDNLRFDGTSCWEDVKCSTKCSGCGCVKQRAKLECPPGYHLNGVFCYYDLDDNPNYEIIDWFKSIPKEMEDLYNTVKNWALKEYQEMLKSAAKKYLDDHPCIYNSAKMLSDITLGGLYPELGELIIKIPFFIKKGNSIFNDANNLRDLLNTVLALLTGFNIMDTQRVLVNCLDQKAIGFYIGLNESKIVGASQQIGILIDLDIDWNKLADANYLKDKIKFFASNGFSAGVQIGFEGGLGMIFSPDKAKDCGGISVGVGLSVSVGSGFDFGIDFNVDGNNSIEQLITKLKVPKPAVSIGASQGVSISGNLNTVMTVLSH